MAYTEINDSNENSIDKKQKNISVELSTLFSQDQNNKAILKISLWNGKIGFEFSKVDQDKPKRVFITFDYEKAIFFTGLINSIVRDRVTAYRSGQPYSTFNIPIENSYIKDGQIHKVGMMYVKTTPVISEITNTPIPRVTISYEQAGDVYEVILCSRIISKQIVDKFATKEIDPDDARLFYISKTLDGIINNLPVLAYLSRIVDIMMGGNNNQKQITSNVYQKKEEFNNNPKARISSSDDVDTIDF